MENDNEQMVVIQDHDNLERGVAAPGQFTSVISANATELAKILMENIEKVKADPKYIPQAEAVNTQIKSMIELGKAEIEMMKVSAFMGR